jgi:hypothetical protein
MTIARHSGAENNTRGICRSLLALRGAPLGSPGVRFFDEGGIEKRSQRFTAQSTFMSVRGPDNNHRAKGMMDTLLADRAEKQPRELAMSPRPDDQQVISSGGVNQDLCGRPLHHTPLDLYAANVGTSIVDRLRDEIFCGTAHVLEVFAD